METVSDPPKLQLRSVGRTFRSKRRRTLALDGIDLDVKSGEFVCLLGESGCGKSTLLHLVAGLDRPSSGSLLLEGKPVEGPGSDRTMVFQSPCLFPWLDVAGNIALGLEIQDRDSEVERRVAELVDLVGLGGFERVLPRELSGGMSQRVALARALAPDPSVLLLDEPYSALDMFTRLRLQDELLRIWERRKVTTLFVTHDIDEAVFLSTKVVILSPRPGRVARIIDNQLARPRDRADPGFVRMKQEIAREFAGLRGTAGVPAGMTRIEEIRSNVR
jgi:NitT/TauT family transport system ATP-binding protein